MYKEPDIPRLTARLEQIEKEAGDPIVTPAAGLALATLGSGMLSAGADFAGNVMKATAHSLDAIATLADKSMGIAAGTAIGTGLAGAYLAYKLKRPKATDIEVDRTNLYKESLKTKIREIRRKQAIDERKRRTETVMEPTLRLQ